MKNTVASKQNVEQSQNNTGNLNLSGMLGETQKRNGTPKEARQASNRGQSAKDRDSPRNQKSKKVGDIHSSSNFMMRSQDMKKTMTSQSSKSHNLAIRKQSVDPVVGNPYNNQ